MAVTVTEEVVLPDVTPEPVDVADISDDLLAMSLEETVDDQDCPDGDATLDNEIVGEGVPVNKDVPVAGADAL